MSRIGSKPIVIPPGVTIEFKGSSVRVKGPKGDLSRETYNHVKLVQKGAEIFVENANQEDSSLEKYRGLYRTLVDNMVQGVVTGFQRILEIQGTGYRAAMVGKALQLNVGLSHVVNVEPPKNIQFEVDKAGKVVISGPDKEAVGQIAARIRAVRPPEPYKGKGVRYSDEVIVTKVGKSASKGKK